MDVIIYEILNGELFRFKIKPSVWAQLWVVQQRFFSYSRDPDIHPTHPVLYSTHSIATVQLQSLYSTYSTVTEFI